MSMSPEMERRRGRFSRDHYEEETEWWADIQRKCYTIIGNKPSITLSEFQQIFLLEVFKLKLYIVE